MSGSFATPWLVIRQASLSMDFSRQEYRSGSLFPSPGDLPDPGTEPMSLALTGRVFTTESPGKAHWFLRAAEPQTTTEVWWLKTMEIDSLTVLEARSQI